MLPQRAHAFNEMWCGRINEVSMWLTMQRESELASAFVREGAWMIYTSHLSCRGATRKREAGHSTFGRMPSFPLKYNAHLPDANVPVGI
jgi:hypothetical protein